MKKLRGYINGVSLQDVEQQLNELHYCYLLSPDQDRTPQEIYEKTFALNFVRGLFSTVKKVVRKSKKKRKVVAA